MSSLPAAHRRRTAGAAALDGNELDEDRVDVVVALDGELALAERRLSQAETHWKVRR